MELGVALSGGGVRSAAQLGIMQALLESGIKPTIFAGTSGGAIVATLLALGYTPKEAFREFKKTNDVLDIAYWEIFKSVFTRKSINGLYRGKKLEKVLDEIFKEKWFTNVENRLAVVTTNINDGRQIIFSNYLNPDVTKINDDNFKFVPSLGTHLSYAVSASTRLPALFMPKKFTDISIPMHDGIKHLKFDHLALVDGGLVNNLPSDIAFSLGAERVISIDLGYTGKAREVEGIYPILKQSMDIMQERVVDSNLKNMDIYLNPEIYDVKVLDLDRIDECFERGYAYGKANINKIMNSLEYKGVEKECPTLV